MKRLIAFAALLAASCASAQTTSGLPGAQVTGSYVGATAWQAGTGNRPALLPNSMGWMGPNTGGTSCLLQLPATLTTGFARAGTAGTVANVCAAPFTFAALNGADLASIYAAGAGTAQAQTYSPSPSIAALTTGTVVLWKPNAANTAAGPTLSISGLTAVTITKCGASALIANDLITTALAVGIYDGTNIELQNPMAGACGGGGSGLPSSSANQTYYSNAGTGASTSALTVNSASAGGQIGINAQVKEITAGAADTTLSSSITNSVTTIPITSATGYPTTGGIILVSNISNSEKEIMTYTGVSGSSLTGATRGKFGTTAAALTSGDTVSSVTSIIASADTVYPSMMILGDGNTIMAPDNNALGQFNLTGTNTLTVGSKVNSPNFCFYFDACFSQNSGGYILQNTGGLLSGVDSLGQTGVTGNSVTVAGTTTNFTPTAYLNALVGTAPTSGTLKVINQAGICALGTIGCHIVVVNLTGTAITVGTGGSPGFAAAYVFSATPIPQDCYDFGGTWYCHN